MSDTGTAGSTLASLRPTSPPCRCRLEPMESHNLTSVKMVGSSAHRLLVSLTQDRRLGLRCPGWSLSHRLLVSLTQDRRLRRLGLRCPGWSLSHRLPTPWGVALTWPALSR